MQGASSLAQGGTGCPRALAKRVPGRHETLFRLRAGDTNPRLEAGLRHYLPREMGQSVEFGVAEQSLVSTDTRLSVRFATLTPTSLLFSRTLLLLPQPFSPLSSFFLFLLRLVYLPITSCSVR